MCKGSALGSSKCNFGKPLGTVVVSQSESHGGSVLIQLYSRSISTVCLLYNRHTVEMLRLYNCIKTDPPCDSDCETTTVPNGLPKLHLLDPRALPLHILDPRAPSPNTLPPANTNKNTTATSDLPLPPPYRGTRITCPPEKVGPPPENRSAFCMILIVISY